MKILLSGYYGFDNAGDEAVLYAIIGTLRETVPQAEITVLSAQPEKTAQQFQVKAVDRWKKSSLFQAIRKTDVLISGGGSLLQDVTSKNGILYYLGIIKLAQLMGKKVMIYAQGIGPIQEPRNQALTARILNKVPVITVRDLDSRQLLVQMGVYREIMVAVDPVLGIGADQVDGAVGERLLTSQEAYQTGRQNLMVSVRKWNHSDTFFGEIAAACDQAVAQGWQVIFVPFHYPEDVEAGREIAGRMTQRAVVLTENYTPQETMSILKQADAILGMRLHSLIMGAALLKPLIGLSYDPKVTSFMQLIRQSSCFALDSIDRQQLVEALERVSRPTEKQQAMFRQTMEIMARQAKEPAELLRQI